ncbi:hypothetical protein AT995_002437, partial [Klebsiella pneumoniae]
RFCAGWRLRLTRPTCGMGLRAPVSAAPPGRGGFNGGSFSRPDRGRNS